MNREQGERYRPVATVLKERKGKPTKLQISGNTYVLQHRDQMYKKKRGISNE
jgi:predicted RecB family nuclease